MVVLVLLVSYIDWSRLWNWFFDVISWVWVYVAVLFFLKFLDLFFLNNGSFGVVSWLYWLVEVVKLIF